MAWVLGYIPANYNWINNARRANDEFINENFQRAIELYSEAVKLDKSRDDIYCNRAQAYIKLENYKEAVEDACDAIAINPKNVKAFLRKGIGLFHLEDFTAAKEAFVAGQKLEGEDKSFALWIRKCDAELDLSNHKDRNVGVAVPSTNSVESPHNGTEPTTKTENEITVQPESTPSIPMPTKEKSRYDWYQTPTHVVVTIMLKNVKQEDAKIDIGEKSLSATIKLPSGSDYCLDLDLSHPINPDQSTVKVLKTKVEVKLKKLEGIQWKKLEGEEPSNVKQINVGSASHYPTSSHYTRNWDKLAHDLTEEEKNEKKEGDAALNDLFQKIYADGSDEQKKAMMKSFYESGGTVLSTNWDEIGKQKTEVKPPDGMEFKKWDS